MAACYFCNPRGTIYEGKYFYIYEDDFPVNPGHHEIVLKRHTTSIFKLTAAEAAELPALLSVTKERIEESHTPNGYTLGINDGEAAGQTVAHLHIHVIPRYTGDVENPRGGIRGVIPGKQKY